MGTLLKDSKRSRSGYIENNTIGRRLRSVGPIEHNRILVPDASWRRSRKWRHVASDFDVSKSHLDLTLEMTGQVGVAGRSPRSAPSQTPFHCSVDHFVVFSVTLALFWFKQVC